MPGSWRRWFGFVVCAAVGCHGPLGPIAGGRLDGVRVENPVADWSFANAYDHAELETRPADPHSVNVNFYVVEGALYVAIGKSAGRHRWRRYIREDPRVRIRFGEQVYDLLAVPVTPGEVEKILPVYYAKDRDRPAAGCEAPYTGAGCSLPSEFVRLVWRPSHGWMQEW